MAINFFFFFDGCTARYYIYTWQEKIDFLNLRALLMYNRTAAAAASKFVIRKKKKKIIKLIVYEHPVLIKITLL